MFFADWSTGNRLFLTILCVTSLSLSRFSRCRSNYRCRQVDDRSPNHDFSIPLLRYFPQSYTRHARVDFPRTLVRYSRVTLRFGDSIIDPRLRRGKPNRCISASAVHLNFYGYHVTRELMCHAVAQHVRRFAGQYINTPIKSVCYNDYGLNCEYRSCREISSRRNSVNLSKHQFKYYFNNYPRLIFVSARGTIFSINKAQRNGEKREERDGEKRRGKPRNAHRYNEGTITERLMVIKRQISIQIVGEPRE